MLFNEAESHQQSQSTTEHAQHERSCPTHWRVSAGINTINCPYEDHSQAGCERQVTKPIDFKHSCERQSPVILDRTNRASYSHRHARSENPPPSHFLRATPYYNTQELPATNEIELIPSAMPRSFSGKAQSKWPLSLQKGKRRQRPANREKESIE